MPAVSRRLTAGIAKFLSVPVRCIEESALSSYCDRLGAVVRPELAEERGSVELHGALADAQRARDLLAGQALGDEPQHLALPTGKRAGAARRPHRRDELRRDPWLQGGPAARDGADGSGDVRGRSALEEIALRASP